MSNELENAAKEWATNASPSLTPSPKGMKLRIRADVETREEAFIAGANWQSQTNEQGKIVSDEDIEAMADKILKCIKNNNPASIRESIINGIKALQLPQPKGSEWISVEDGLPEVGECALVNVGTDTVLKGRLFNDGWVCFFADGEHYAGEVRPVTHWMTLPTPPHQQQGGEKVDEK